MVNDRYGLKLSKPQLEGLRNYRCNTCITCKAKQKATRKLTANPPRIAQAIMDCWCVDLMGPFAVVEDEDRITLPSYYGHHYILIIVDEYSRYAIAVPIYKKSDTSIELIKIIKRYQNTTGKNLKRLHSDGGGEFINSTLKAYLDDNGIEQTITVPNTLIHNPIVERMNQSLEAIARCLLEHSHAPQEMWSDAMMHAALIYNHICQPSIDGDIPAMRLPGTTTPPLDIDKIRVFGCDVQVVTDPDHRGKFQPRTQPGVYIGYDPQYNNHKVILIDTMETVVRRSVIFHEDSFTHLTQIARRVTQLAQDRETEASSEHKQWIVKRITEERIRDDKREYLVHWKGWRYPTWEPADIIEEDCPIAVQEFEQYKETVYAHALSIVYCNTSITEYKEPSTIEEALNGPDASKWMEAIHSELLSLNKNKIATLAYLPEGKKAIGCKWIFKVKRNESNEIVRYKARLVIQGFRQVQGEDFWETFSPTVHIKSIKWLLAIAAQEDLEIKQIDFDTAFLNASISEDIYMKIPPSYYVKGIKPGMVLKLNKALYGLKQAPREWWLELDKTLKSLGYESSPIDECLYMKIINNQRIYLTIYVDDTLAIYPIHWNLHGYRIKTRLQLNTLLRILEIVNGY